MCLNTVSTVPHILSPPPQILTNPIAPLVYLDKKETYNPSDIAKHVKKTHPAQNFTTLLPNSKFTLDNLSDLNKLNNSKHIFLTAIKDNEKKGDEIKIRKFLHGKEPDAKTLQTHRAESAAVIVVEKDDGIVDAFYMYFYSFNAGPHALGHVAGNHVGDWYVSLSILPSPISNSRTIFRFEVPS